MDALNQMQHHQEELRLEALGRYRLLDTAAEGSFDSITRLAALRLRTPIAVVSLVDRSRAWFKSRHGLDVKEVPYHLTSDTPLLPDEALWISDTQNAADCHLPEEIAQGVRFYAAAPLKTYHGFNLGTLSVMDYRPRDLNPRELGELQDLAASVMKQIETRRLKFRFRRSHSMFQPKAKRRCRSAPTYRTPTFDPLTALPDRHTLMDRLGRLLGAGDHATGALLVVDVDRFRILNGELGYAVGDQVLTEVARRLEALKGSQDTVARLGSDEFALLLPTVITGPAALKAARRLRDHLVRPVRLTSGEMVVSVRVGAASIGERYMHPDEVLRDAELALAGARSEEAATCQLFDATRHRFEADNDRLAGALRQAFDKDELRLAYQPIVHLESGRVQGFEALVRWQHAERGLLKPSQFLPTIFSTGLLPTLTRWTLSQACAQLGRLRQRFPHEPRWTVSVNLDCRQLETTLVDTILDLLEKHGLHPGDLRLEITENAMVEHCEAASETLELLREKGIALHIDDFGTGYATLSYLRSLPGSTVKIDRSFVTEMLSDPRQYEIVRSVIDLAHSLHMEVVAEGIETEPIRDALEALGCDLGQGFFFSRPLAAEKLEELIESGGLWLTETLVH